MSSTDSGPENHPESQFWNNLEKIAKLFSITMIPVVLAIGGWLIQRHLQEQSVQRDYVQLAVSILREEDASKVNPILRTWAVDLLSKNSPVPIESDLAELLKNGKARLPELTLNQDAVPLNVRRVRACLSAKEFHDADPATTTAVLRLSKYALGFFTDTFLEFDQHTFLDPSDFNPDYAAPQFELVSAGLIKENSKEKGELDITPLGLKARSILTRCLKEGASGK